ncbi:MAG: ABC transporter permease subunit [Anaerocolumna sp.]
MPVKRKKLRKFIPIYIMLLPGFLYLLVNNYIPMFGIVIAFKQLNFAKGIIKSDWVGFANFEYLFKTPEAFRITRNTLGYNAVFIVVNLVVAVAIAILLSEIRNKRCVKVYQTLILLPYLISMVIVSYLAYAFLSGQTGFINGLLGNLGLAPVSFYSEPQYWPFILVFVNCWKGAGYASIIYLASIMGIDQELYEAAAIDGSSKWEEIKYITLPLLKPTMIILTLMSIGRIFYSDFGLFYQLPMNSGALIDATNTIDTYVYRGLINMGDLSMSSAAGVYQSLIGFILVMLANAITKKFSKENALF